MKDRCVRYITKQIPWPARNLVDFGDRMHVQIPTKSMADLSEWLTPYGVEIGFAEAFRKTPGPRFPNELHLDGFEFDDHVKINFVYGVGDSTMSWWQLKPGQNYNKKVTVVGTEYIWANVENCQLIEKSPLAMPAIVNAGQLHLVEDISETRICYSVMLRKNQTKERLLWDDAMELFKDVI